VKKLTLILLVFTLQGKSQSTNCQLKSPAVTIQFGSGEISDINTASLVNYRKVIYPCPGDGHYTYTSATSNCFGGDWHTLSEDHTPGDIDGNMMLVNSSYNTGSFFTTIIKGLKGNTPYEFGVWLINLCKITKKCPFPLLPNITIQLKVPSGKIVAAFTTGEVVRHEAPHWTQYRARFVTPPSVTAITVVMINNAPGGCGNDFALDDITFRECVPIPLAQVRQKTSLTPKQQPLVSKSSTKSTKPVQTNYIAKQPTNSPLPLTPLSSRKLPDFPAPPPALSNRANPMVKHFETEEGEIRLDLYDNGEVDGDTVSIYHNNSLVVAQAKLSQKPITLHIAVNDATPHHELVMVAENFGSIPPITSLMIVTTGTKRYQVFISSTEQKNAKVIFDLKK
jgi:hypothetical protein